MLEGRPSTLLESLILLSKTELVKKAHRGGREAPHVRCLESVWCCCYGVSVVMLSLPRGSARSPVLCPRMLRPSAQPYAPSRVTLGTPTPAPPPY